MYIQNMSEKIARSVRSNFRRGEVTLNWRDQRSGSFDAQNKSKIPAISTFVLGKLPLKLRLWHFTTKCFAIKTLSHIQQTQRNTRHLTAHSFSGETIL
jgi:hypothetical protein